MKIIDVEQGTEEWLRVRAGKPTGSVFSKIITNSLTMSTSWSDLAFQLASDMVVSDLEQTYKSKDMERGNELEPDAAQEYERHTFRIVEFVGFCDCDDYGYSPDGFVGDDGVIEIKCPAQKTHAKYLYENRVPPKYYAQVQGALYVTGRKWVDFVSYHPKFPKHKRLFIYRQKRDEDFIKALGKGIEKVVKKRNEVLEKIK
jgi:putative phage-type endonuclease